MNNEAALTQAGEPLDTSPELSDNSVFPQETMEALEELGVIFQRAHERMVAEGYTIIDGKIVKLDVRQQDDNNQSNRKDTV
jgi:hypothetical protein